MFSQGLAWAILAQGLAWGTFAPHPPLAHRRPAWETACAGDAIQKTCTRQRTSRRRFCFQTQSQR
eukprot:15464064-Alexandrium_andersonii.AAC.1